MKHKPKTLLVALSINLKTSPRNLLYGKNKGLAAYGWDEEELTKKGLIRGNCSWDGWTYYLTEKGREFVADLPAKEIYDCKFRLHRLGYYVDEFAIAESF